MASVSTDPMICIAYPTIMDGLVLRWYADAAAYDAGQELANASRNSFVTFDGCSPEVRALAVQAHSYLTVAYAARLHPQLDVSRWTTHRHTRGPFSSDITPIERAAVAVEGEGDVPTAMPYTDYPMFVRNALVECWDAFDKVTEVLRTDKPFDAAVHDRELAIASLRAAFARMEREGVKTDAVAERRALSGLRAWFGVVAFPLTLVLVLVAVARAHAKAILYELSYEDWLKGMRGK